jgi:transposase InsO family protein
VGDALDNALMESTIGLFKTELVDRHDRSWTGRAELERETVGWVHWYNTARLHSALGHVPPVEYEQHYRGALPLPRHPRWPEPRLRRIQAGSVAEPLQSASQGRRLAGV